MFKAIFTDLDGVLRHWHNHELFAVEANYGLPQGFLFQHAFADELLIPTITGKQTHDVWTRKIVDVLSAEVEPNIAEELVSAWSNTSYSIDLNLLAAFKTAAPDARLVLVTNATDRLDDDLRETQLPEMFDCIVNSSVIGFAKPDAAFYQAAIETVGVETSQVLYIDDSIANVDASHNLGFTTVHFENRGQALAELAAAVHGQ